MAEDQARATPAERTRSIAGSSRPDRRLGTGLAAILAGLCLAAATSSAQATSLEGQPFLLDPSFEGYRLYSSIFSYRRGFAASLSQASGNTAPSELHFKAFSAAGKTTVEKVFVAKGRAAEPNAPHVVGSGGLQLNGGKALVAYLDIYRSAKKQNAVGGLFARTIGKKGKPDAGAFTLDDAKRDIVPTGQVLRLADKRGLALWTVQDPEGRVSHVGRFIAKNGDLGRVDVDLDKNGAELWGVSPFGAGFVTLHRNVRNFSNASFIGQAYAANGKKIGAATTLLNKVDPSQYNSLSLIGLEGEKLLLLNTAKSGTFVTLVGQVYDKGWNRIGDEKTLMSGLGEERYSVAALPGGGVLVAAVFTEGESKRIEFRRFDQQLKQIGEVARTGWAYNMIISQILALDNGRVVAVYDKSNKKEDYILLHTGQLIEP